MAYRKKYEPWMKDVASGAILEGLPLSLISGLLKVSTHLVRKWYQEGSSEDCRDPALVEFASAIDSARSEAGLKNVRLMSQHALLDYRAAMELFKVSDPETWNTARKVQVDSQVTHRLPDRSGLSDDELLQLEALESKMLPKGT